MKVMKAALVALSVSLAMPVYADQASTSNMEILRDKVKADKKLVVAANMQLNDAEGKAFWPVYESYQNDLKKLNDQLATVINAYAAAYNKGSLTNDVAKKLTMDALVVDEAELKLKRTYASQVEKAVGAIKAARYLQLENKIRAEIKYELAAAIPLAQ